MVSKNQIGNYSMNLLTAIAIYWEDNNTVYFSQDYYFMYNVNASRTIILLFLFAIA